MSKKSFAFQLKLYLFFFLVQYATVVVGQGLYIDGFIINLEGDTIKGKLIYKTHPKNYKHVSFNNEDNAIRYSPEEIRGFGFWEDSYFSSQIIQGKFVEALVLGKISLYKGPDNYLLVKEGKKYSLDSKEEAIIVNGKEKIRQGFKWKGIVTYLISDCLEDAVSLTKNLHSKEKPLIKLITNYNECQGETPILYKNKLAWVKLKLGAQIGLASSEIKIEERGPNIPYIPETINASGLTGGVYFNLYSPKTSNRISFETGIEFTNNKYSSRKLQSELYSFNQELYYDTEVEISTVSIPFALNYSLPFNKYRLQLKIGGNFDMNQEKETKLTRNTLEGEIVVTSPIRKNVNILDRRRLGVLTGLEFFRDFGKFEGGISLRYKADERILFNQQYSRYKYHSYNNRLSIGLKLVSK